VEKLLTPIVQILPAWRSASTRAVSSIGVFRVRPVHLIDVDGVGTQPAQRILDLLVYPHLAQRKG
jgi:hypothetical protein